VQKDRKQKFEVAVSMPAGYNVSEIREYLRDAIANWSGQLDPNDQLFYAFNSRKSLTVKPIKSN